MASSGPFPFLPASAGRFIECVNGWSTLWRSGHQESPAFRPRPGPAIAAAQGQWRSSTASRGGAWRVTRSRASSHAASPQGAPGICRLSVCCCFIARPFSCVGVFE